MKNNERDQHKTRKVLVPLATLAVAAAVAVGSGATFTSTSNISANVTAGQIIAENNHKDGSLKVTELKPGDSAQGTVTLTEGAASDLNGNLSVELSGVTSAFEDNAVTVTVFGNGVTKTVDLEDIETSATTASPYVMDLGRLADGWATRNVRITVSMDSLAGNANQGKTAGANIAFVLTATDGSTDHETTATW